ncbi:MAG: response regulator [Chloroflexi bacterium]|nr:response regulator [Chloroflexota bacterium]
MSVNLAQPILAVEDSDEDFEALRWAFKKLAATHPIFRCKSGDDALDFLYLQGKYPDLIHAPRPALILLDLNLPGTDGREVLEQIKQDAKLQTIPVVVFTTSANPRDLELCYRNGANSYQLKPVDLQKFLKSVEALLDYWFQVAVLPEPAER